MITFQKLIPGRMCYTLHKHMPTPKQISQRWIKSLVLVKERESKLMFFVLSNWGIYKLNGNLQKIWLSQNMQLWQTLWESWGLFMKKFMMMAWIATERENQESFHENAQHARKWSSSMVTMSDHITFKRKKMQCIYRQQQEITDHVPSAQGRRVWVSIFEWSSGEAMPQLSFD